MKRIEWDEALERIAKLMKEDRDANFVEKNEQGQTVNRWLTTGFSPRPPRPTRPATSPTR